jgi:hypothetical protein
MLAALQRMEQRQQQTEQRLVDMAASQNASIDDRLNARLHAPLPPNAPVSGLRRRLVSFFGDAAAEPEEGAAPAAVDLSDGARAAATRPPAPAADAQQRTQAQRRGAAFGAGDDTAHAPAADEDDGDVEYAEALDAQLDALELPAERELSEFFGGHPLPCPHEPRRRWKRDDNFESVTCHYHAGAAGDHLRGKFIDRLERLGEAQREAGSTEWGTTYAYELRTLLPACSYLVDAHAQSAQLARTAAHAVRVGHLDEDALATLPQQLVDVTEQLNSIFQHLKERVDVLHACERQSLVDVELMSRLYDSEERVAGDRSLLGAQVERMSLAGETRRLIARSATERAASSRGASLLTPHAAATRERAIFRAGQQQQSRRGQRGGQARTRAAGSGQAARGQAGPAQQRAPAPAPAQQQWQQQPRAAAAAPRPAANAPQPAPAPAKGAGQGRGNAGGRGGGRT